MSQSRSSAEGARSPREYVLGGLLLAVTVGVLGGTVYFIAFRPDPAAHALDRPLRYKCRQCGHEFEVRPTVVASGSAAQEDKPAFGPPDIKCPACGAEASAGLMVRCDKCGRYFLPPPWRPDRSGQGMPDQRCPHCNELQ